MIDKPRLKKLLEECVKLETDAIALYAQKIESPAFFQIFLPEDRERVQKALAALAEDARSHKGILEAVLAKVQGAEKNEF